MTDSQGHEHNAAAPRTRRRRRLGLVAAAVPMACLLLIANPMGSAALLGSVGAQPDTTFVLSEHEDSDLPVDPGDLLGGDVPPDTDDAQDTATAAVSDAYLEATQELIGVFQQLADVWEGPVESAEPALSAADPLLKPLCNAYIMALISYMGIIEGYYKPDISTRPIYLLTFNASGPVLVACSSSNGGSELDAAFVALDEAADPALAATVPVLWDLADALAPVRGFGWAAPAGAPALRELCGEMLEVWRPALVSLPPPANRIPVLGLVCQGERTDEVNDTLQATAQQVGTATAPTLVDVATELQPAAEVASPALRPVCTTGMTSLFVGSIVLAAVSPNYGGLVLGLPATVPLYILCPVAISGQSPADPVFEQLDEAAGPTFSELVAALDEAGVVIAPVQSALDEAAEDVEDAVSGAADAGTDLPADPCSLAGLLGVYQGEQNMPAPTNRISPVGFACHGRATPR